MSNIDLDEISHLNNFDKKQKMICSYCIIFKFFLLSEAIKWLAPQTRTRWLPATRIKNSYCQKDNIKGMSGNPKGLYMTVVMSKLRWSASKTKPKILPYRRIKGGY